MAREEADREDLLAEATALVRRVEFSLPAFSSEPIVAGFRAGGAGSLFVSPREVYHFNSAGELRRAYLDPLLYKAERGRLVSLRRQRTAQQSLLVRHDLTADEQSTILSRAVRALTEIGAALESGQVTLRGEVPVGGDVLAEVAAWIGTLLASELPVARRPHVS